ncbi:MAG: hypothetical protein HOE90_11095 [Bacteriovoracaceae bacterium]|jgi:hypothetical protein|nr:hypothetical protein [Bacteriovoracaceae bacterium]
MILNRKYQNAVVGKNIYSLMLAIGVHRNDQSVLMLDDENIGIGHNFNSFIGEMEYQLLKLWGEKWNIECLKKIEDFSVNSHVIGIFNDVQILGGRSPYKNLREIFRKKPGLFPKDFFVKFSKIDRDQFDQSMMGYFKRMSSLFFYSHRVEEIGVHSFKEIPQKIVAEWIQFLLANKNSLEVKEFLYSLSGGFQGILCPNFNALDFYYLPLKTLCPGYYLDASSLEKSLLELFVSEGGHLKNTEIMNWEFEGGRPKYIQLNSFEGVIEACEVHYLGRIYDGPPLLLRRPEKKYGSFEINLKLSELSCAPSISDTPFVAHICERQWLGSEFPFLQVVCLPSEDKLRVTQSYQLKLGQNPKLRADDLIPKIKNSLSTLMSDKEVERFAFSDNWSVGHEHWSGVRGRLAINRVIAREFNAPTSGRELSNFSYLGPFSSPSLGPISILMEVKNLAH